MLDLQQLSEGFNLRMNLVPGYVYGTDYIIQYGHVATPSASQCGNTSATWVSDPAAVTGGPVNAVRAITLGDKAPPSGHDYRWTLDVPLKITASAVTGDVIPFWSARKMLPAQPAGGPVMVLDNTWIGQGTYNPATHSGDARYGSRVRIANASLSIDKTSEFGDTFSIKPGEEATFEVTVGVHGNGAVPLKVEDLLTNGMTYVPGSAIVTPSSGLTISAPSEPAVGPPPAYLTSIVGSQLTWDFGTISGANNKTITITYKAKVNSDAPAGGTGYNLAIARGGQNTGGASQVTPTDPDGAVATMAFQFSNAYWELNVRKQAGSSPIFPGEDASYSLTYKNSGTKAAESVSFIDVFPFNGDADAPELGETEIGRDNGSDYSGSLKLATASGTDETFLYTSAAPASISLDPLDATNLPATGSTVWCQPAGGTQPLYGHFGDPGCPANLAAATAVRFTTGSALKPATSRTVTLTFNTAGNHAGDQYTNNYGGRVNPPSTGSSVGTPVLMGISNDVTIEVRALRLGDYVWLDADRDGIQDASEAPIAGVKVDLLDASGTQVATTTTDANGLYIFEDLVPGDYTVRFATPAGLAPTTATAGSDTTADSNPTGGLAPVTLTGNEPNDENLTIDAGFYPLASLGDYVWVDADHDGVQDAGETPVQGVTVTLSNASGTVATTTTDAAGKYLFANLVPGDYTVTFSNLPSGYVVTTTGAGTNTTVDSNGLVSSKANLAAGENDLTYDLGIWQPAALGDRVWHDTNANGVQDTGEADVPGVTVTLTDAGGSTVATAVTDSNGLYRFSNLIPGEYTVTFSDLPAGYVVTETNAAGSTAANNSNGLVSTKANLAAGETDLTFDLGIYRPGSIGDFVWNDLDHDGIQDSGETGVPGVTVTLTDSSGTVATTTTDAGGGYLFDGLPPGTYTVTFSDVPSGFILSPTGAGSNTAVDSNGLTTTVALAEGQDIPTIDLGIFETAALGDYVWIDADHDGVQDAGETPVQGVTVTLSNASGTVATTTTDAAGKYLFPNLVPGDYTVTFSNLPSGYVVTKTGSGSDTTVDSNGLVSTKANLAPGETDLTYDLGIWQPASLGDFVWHDTNLNGIQDAGEAPVAGVTVTLSDASGTVATATTDAAGKYLFPNLVPGDYTVTFSNLPSGYVVTKTGAGTNTTVDSNGLVSTKANLAAGENDLTYDLGIYRPGSIGDFVWNDLDHDGIQDSGETGVPGVTVTLTDSSGTVATTTTDADGGYLFDDLVPGTYTVTFSDLPAGYTTSPTGAGSNTAVDSNGLTTTVPLAEGQHIPTIDLGIYETAGLGDYVWHDTNADGIQDPSEAPFPGVTVELRNGAGTLVGTQVTDADGAYSFTGLTPGDYTVTFVRPAGYVFTERGAGSDNAVDSNPATATGVTATVTLAAGDYDPTIDAGLYRPASVGDYVWHDTNVNGVQDAGEQPVPGVTVTLTDASGATVATTTTDAAGAYLFDQLVPGTYTVTFSNTPAGYAVTSSHAGSDNAVDSNGVATTVTLDEGEHNPTIDLGIYRPASLGDYVWDDVNHNGIQDSGETGVPGVTVTLTDADGATVATATTDADGAYGFTGLVPGTYTVKFTDLPTGYTVSPTGAGSDNAVDSNGLTTTVDLAEGEHNPTLDLGIHQEASLGDFVWHDKNRDGIQDSDEDPVSGVTVTLLDADGATVATAVTDADGSYLFDHLAPGTYTVKFSDLPAGWAVTTTGAGSDTAADSNGLTSTVTLSAGEHDPTIDLGIYELASVGDYVWHDTDHDGIQDGNEPGLPGVKVTLTDSDGNTVATTVTGDGGDYSFTDLVPGTYTVTFSGLPDGYTVTTTGAGSDTAADSNGLTTTVTLGEGEHDPTIDLGAYLPASVGDFVWIDANHNGIQEAGEQPVPGVTVTLTDRDGNTVATAVTDTDGSYLFDQLVPGTYTVTFSDLPAGYATTVTGAGGDAAADSNGLTTTVDLAEGEHNPTIDLGVYAQPAAIKVVKYVEGDDANEAPGITLTVGDKVTWTYKVTNTGEVPLVDVTLADDIEGAVECPKTTLAVDETMTCKLEGTVIKGLYTNTGTVTATSSFDDTTKVTDHDPANYTGTEIDVPPTSTTTSTTSTTQPTTTTTKPGTPTSTSTTEPGTPSTTKPGTPPATVTPNPGGPDLPVTGANVVTLIGIASVLIAGGVLILGARRRRRTAEA
jgi:fimbrial isopeptide formation D2 family protein/uncharacterized repeat protein (TIGR01451 family)